MPDSAIPEQPKPGPVDAVLLIDGDNDPHLPPDFLTTIHTLVRIFLRPGAKTPRGLERKLGHLPLCVTVTSPKGGSNAADFVMSLHAGLLHAVLPLHLPFTLVTHDKSLAAMAQELQRLGRIANLWTSHPEGGRGRARLEDAEPRPAARRASSRGRRRGPARGSRAKAPSVQSTLAAPAQPPKLSEPARLAAPQGRGGGSLVEVAARYALRLARIKDPPTRAKALMNDITNRTSGFPAEDILAELKRSQGLSIDEQGRVRRSATPAA